MNLLVILLVLVIFVYVGGSNVPKVLSHQKELLLGVLIGVVIYPMLSLEGIDDGDDSDNKSDESPDRAQGEYVLQVNRSVGNKRCGDIRTNNGQFDFSKCYDPTFRRCHQEECAEANWDHSHPPPPSVPRAKDENPDLKSDKGDEHSDEVKEGEKNDTPKEEIGMVATKVLAIMLILVVIVGIVVIGSKNR